MVEQETALSSHADGRYKRNYMTKCYKCKTRIVTHLWVIDNLIYCSLRCERGKGNRYSDSVVEKIGVAGLAKKK